MKSNKAVLFVGAVLLFGAAFGLAKAADLTYEGSSTIGENVMPDAVKAFSEKTKIPFGSVGLGGSGKGFEAWSAGKVPLAGLSRELSDDEKSKNPNAVTIGFDAIAVYVNANNPIKDISKDQLKGIFTGKITNWKEVGGSDAKIEVVTEIKSGTRATIKEFKHLALDGAEYGPTKEIDKPHDCVKYVVTNTNAITYASSSFREPGVKFLAVNGIGPLPHNVRAGKYLLGRPLILISGNPPTPEVKAFMEFMTSPDGQGIVAKKFITNK